MSFAATRWAWSQQQGIKAATKLVLLALADRADNANECYPSIGRISNDTRLDRKTVIKALAALRDLDLIRDSGKRMGRTNQVVAYRLLINDTETGTVPKTEPFHFSEETVPFFPANSTVFPKKGSQKRDTESKNNLPIKKTTKHEKKELWAENCAKLSEELGVL